MKCIICKTSDGVRNIRGSTITVDIDGFCTPCLSALKEALEYA